MNLPKMQILRCLLLLVMTCALSAEVGAQTVTKTFKNSTLKTVLSEIESQTKYSVVYEVDGAVVNKKVSASFKNASLSDVLNKVLGDDLTYTISNRMIVISHKASKKASTTGTSSAKKQVRGQVLDQNGEPVIGATVQVPGTSIGASTDLDGRFSLTVPEGSNVKVSYVGYQATTIKAQDNLSVTLHEDNQVLDEVVVTALGIKRKQKALSYNVQEIGNEKLTTVKDANFMNSLIGKVAGAEIQTGAAGAGGSVRVVMRGMKSITKDNNALYVIDGVPMFNNSVGGGTGQYGNMGGTESSADINPDDVESVSVMTGPAAAALYGNAAANGVVLITTKRGDKEKTSVTVSNSTTFSTPYIMPEMQNTYGTSSGIQNWGEKETSNYDPKNFFNTGSNVINSFSLSTGTKKNQTYLSASATNSDGILPNSTYDRYNFSVRNTTSFLNDRMTLDVGASYIIQKNRNMVTQGVYFNPLTSLYLFPRSEDFDEIRLFERWDVDRGYMVQQWNYGDNSLAMQNPYWVQKRILRESSKKRYMLNASLKFEIADWVNIVGRVNLDNSDYRNQQKKYASTLTTFCGVNGGYQDEMQQSRSVYADAMLNIDKTLSDFRVNANIGASIYDISLESMGNAGDLLSPNFFALNNLNYQTNYKPLQSGWHDQTQSIFANLELGWRSMLYLTLTGRADWESKLAFSDHPAFFYPSVGVSAVLSEMIALPEFISYAKARASYTKVASSFERYLTNPRYVYNEQTHNWTNPTTFPAKNLKPEDTKSWEVGLDVIFWNRLNLNLTYYHSNTYNQTFRASIPSSSGYSNAIVQTGNVQNYGIEAALGYKDNWGGFGWNTNVTFTLNRNKVKRLANGATNPVTGEIIEMPELQVAWLGKANVAPQVILREGGTMTDIYVYNHLKTDNNGNLYVNPQTGNMEMVTENEAEKVGKLAPDFSIGWTNNFSWKGITLGAVISARVGGLAYSATQGVLDYYGASQASADMRDNGGIWINRGMVDAQKYYQAIATGEGGYGRYYLYDATSIRLRELSLNYTFPRKMLHNVADVTVGVVGNNLWMIYCKAPFDPELSASTSSNFYQNVDYFMQPSTRNIGFNVKLNF
ncbi:MAG: SusC/RagA family TonB-linked outer membrane protein [Muribaculaceae bacterium]